MGNQPSNNQNNPVLPNKNNQISPNQNNPVLPNQYNNVQQTYNINRYPPANMNQLPPNNFIQNQSQNQSHYQTHTPNTSNSNPQYQHSNRINDRQFNTPNIQYDPHNARNIYSNNNQYTPYTINKPQTEYMPRMEQPQFQSRVDKNTMENQYQNAYEQRNMDTGFTNGSLPNQTYQDNTIPQNTSQFLNKELDMALKIFQLPKKYSEMQLKNTYKELVLRFHPDRGGDNNKFQLINKCYTYLLKQLELEIKDAQFEQLKNQSTQFIEKQETHQSINIDKDNFDVNQFNQVFSDNKLEYDEDRAGYSDWMNHNKYDTTDINQHKELSGKFSVQNFNQVFSQNSNTDKMELVEYKDPIPTEMNNNLSFSEIDDQSKDDYSSGVNSGILYTDYKKAHTKTHLIDPNSVNRKQYKTVDDLEQDRDRINFQMSEQDLLEEKLQQDRLKQQEEERIARVQNKDQKITNHFDKVNRIMLGNQ